MNFPSLLMGCLPSRLNIKTKSKVEPKTKDGSSDQNNSKVVRDSIRPNERGNISDVVGEKNSDESPGTIMTNSGFSYKSIGKQSENEQIHSDTKFKIMADLKKLPKSIVEDGIQKDTHADLKEEIVNKNEIVKEGRASEVGEEKNKPKIDVDNDGANDSITDKTRHEERLPKSSNPPGETVGLLESLITKPDGIPKDKAEAKLDDIDEVGDSNENETRNDDDDLDVELLRQYIIVEYEITQLEDRDVLRIYHEKIEKLEQLDRELDLVSSEVEEVTSLSDHSKDGNVESENSEKARAVCIDSISHSVTNSGHASASNEPNSSMSEPYNDHPRHLNEVRNFNNNNKTGSGQIGKRSTGRDYVEPMKKTKKGTSNGKQVSHKDSRSSKSLSSTSKPTYDVFNRKIILEKERDRLKKGVEQIIIECDKLQQKYKRRDEILDKLFDGKTGNGLEDHLEQQLNWLLEQKHYVDQVFYVWKRAETLTSQTCEHFSDTLELLKKLPQIEDPKKLDDSIKEIARLLIKSRQGMEQAQKYNPNVDAPFFTENETDRFDKIIEKITNNRLTESDFSQILTIIQFAYKRTVSIRSWLEQILQATISRDSFELAEEYKWIAIQLRKERINLIKARLSNEPYRSMVSSIQNELARQQSATMEKKPREVNRDSGIESEQNDIDIEDEIYRLLEMNKSRLEGCLHVSNLSNLEVEQKPVDQFTATSGEAKAISDQEMMERIQRRTSSNKLLSDTLHQTRQVTPISSTWKQLPKHGDSSNRIPGEESSLTMITPTRLKVELDEEARKSLLKQIDQIHNRHRNKIEVLRGSNRAKATDSLLEKMRESRRDKTDW